MDTLAFNILLPIFSVLFVLCVVVWIKASKTKAYIKANNPHSRISLTVIVIGISILAALFIWFLMPSIRFRAIAVIAVLDPMILFLYRTRTLPLRIRLLGLLTFCVYIPIIVLYLK